MSQPEQQAREKIDQLLARAGWCHVAQANIHASRGVADGVNVNYDDYRIKTAITEDGSRVEAGYCVEKQERDTRKTRWEELDGDFAYDQIRTIVRTFRDKLFSEIFPGRRLQRLLISA